MKSKLLPVLLSVGGGLIMAASVLAETPKIEFPAPSPACTLKQHVGLTDITVEYSRPSVKGRDIFGGLIPFGSVWRTGANQATKIIFSTPVKLNGTEIPAGTYALMTIPGKDEWTVIINKGAEQWGAYKYDEKTDVARIKAKPVAIDRSIEAFTINIDPVNDETASLNLLWDKTKVPVEVKLDYADKLSAEIEKVMASDDKKKPYFQSAAFYFYHDKDLKKAKEWVDAALADRDAHYIAFLKAQILAKMGDKAGAIAAAKHSSELATKANDLGYVKMNDDLIASLK